MSKTKANPNGLPTIEEVFAGQDLTLMGEPGADAPPAPSWATGEESIPMPAALVEELAGLHAEKRAAEASVNEVEGRRANLFRGFLIGCGMSLTAQYDLSTGRVTATAQE